MILSDLVLRATTSTTTSWIISFCRYVIVLLVIHQDPIENMLRLLSLYSLVNNGIKAKQYDAIKREIINVYGETLFHRQTYGFKYLLSIHKLEQLGFIKVRESNSVWSNLSNKLKLVNSDVDLDTQDDMRYAFLFSQDLQLCDLLYCSPQLSSPPNSCSESCSSPGRYEMDSIMTVQTFKSTFLILTRRQSSLELLMLVTTRRKYIVLWWTHPPGRSGLLHRWYHLR